jgi:ribosomal protein S26
MTMEEICERLVHLGVDMKWSQSVIERLQKAKEYLKTDYKVHCQDHCRAFTVSDTSDKEFQVKRSHEHTMKCENCENLKSTVEEICEKL